MAKPKKIPMYKQWYQQMIVDDQKDIWDMACAAAERLSLNHIDVEPELAMAMYCGILESYMEYLKGMQSSHPQFFINIKDVLEIGYDTLENDEDEKTGNFNIKVYYLPDAPKVITNYHKYSSGDEVLTAWVTTNMNTDEDALLRDIAIFSKKYLMQHYNITIERAELVIMIFLMINEEIINTVRLKRQENNTVDFFVTIAGLFQIHCSDTDQGEMIFFKTEPAPKQFIKDDGVGTAKFEN